MGTILSEIPLIPGSDHCVLVCLRSILSGHGVADPDLYLASDWDFEYSRREESNVGVVRAFSGDRLDGLRRNGYEIREMMPSSDEEAWASLTASIDRGNPQVLWVDQSCLPFWKTPRNWAHTLLAYGYSEQSVWVIDGWAFIQYQGSVARDALEKARSSKNPWQSYHPWLSGHPIERKCLEINLEGEIQPPTQVAEEYVRNITNRLSHSENETTNQGILEMASDLRLMCRLEDTETRSSLLDLYVQLDQVVLQRSLALSVFGHIEKVTSRAAWTKIEERAGDLARSWAIARNLILRVSRTGEPGTLSRVANRLEDIAGSEVILDEEVGNAVLAEPVI